MIIITIIGGLGVMFSYNMFLVLLADVLLVGGLGILSISCCRCTLSR